MAKKPVSGVGVRAFARSLGVADSAVRQAISSGRIPPSCVGYRTVGADGRRWPVITAPERAARYWNDSRNPAKVRAASAPPGKRACGKARGAQAGAPDSGRADAASTPEETSAIEAMLAAGKLPTIEQSQRVINAYKARMAKLEHDQKCGELVNKADVVAEYAAVVVTARTLLLGVPAKFKARAPEVSVAQVQLLETLIREALETLADGQT